MFAKWAQLINSPAIRVFLYLVGFPLTLIFGAFGIFGIVWGLLALPDSIFLLLYALAGVFGLVAAWLRITVPQLLHRSPTIRLTILCALIAGTLLAGWQAIFVVGNNSPLIPWLSLVALPIGLFLVGATIGAKHVP